MRNPDYQLFILWHKSLEYKEKLYEIISENFEIVHFDKLFWKTEQKYDNLSRLYFSIKKSKTSYKISYKGKNPFILVIVVDKYPRFSLRHNINGNIPLVNQNITDLKDTLRNFVGGNYIHSTDNFYEFINQCAMILGVEDTKQILASNSLHKVNNFDNIEFKENNLVGYDGFENYNQLLDLLNLTNNYVLLRESFSNGNIHLIILTDKKNMLLSTIGSRVENNKRVLVVSNQKITLEISELNDSSLDPLFQKHILDTKVMIENRFTLNQKVKGFYLLYNFLLKKSVETHISEVNEALRETGLINFDDKRFNTSLSYRVNLLQGYFRENGYKINCNNITNISNLRIFEEDIINCNQYKYKVQRFLKNLIKQFKKIIKRVLYKTKQILIIVYKKVKK